MDYAGTVMESTHRCNSPFGWIPPPNGVTMRHNPISIIIPCHRVVGAGGSLTGYAGGIAIKEKLLTLEKADLSKRFASKSGTAYADAQHTEN